MTQKLDYSKEDAIAILNSQNYSDVEKKQVYEQYMSNLKKNRKTAIVSRLNKCAENIPTITKEDYISELKKLTENDDLSVAFNDIEKELSKFELNMKGKYEDYLKKQKEIEEPAIEEIIPDVSSQVVEEDNFDDTIFSEPVVNIEVQEEVKPSLVLTDEISVLNENPDNSGKPLFDSESSKEVIPDIDNEKEKGNASAIILSIIAIIVGLVVMYSIIKLN